MTITLSDKPNAIDNYNRVRKVRLRTWTTFRVNVGERFAIMTYGNTSEKSLLSANNDDRCPLALDLMRSGGIKEISNFDQWINAIFAEAAKAASAGLFIRSDVYNYFVENGAASAGVTTLDYILGDLDQVIRPTLSKGSLEALNFRHLLFNLNQFLKKYLTPTAAAEYYARIIEKVDELI